MDLIHDLGLEIAETTGLDYVQAVRMARELITRQWITVSKARTICAKRRYMRLYQAGLTAEEARIDIETRYDMTEGTSRMLVYRDRNYY